MAPSSSTKSTLRARNVLTVQRSYQDGVRVIFDPTPEELTIASDGDLRRIWNSDRSRWVTDLI